MDADQFQKEVGEIAKELIGATVGAMSFGQKRVLTKIFFENMLGGCFNIIFPVSRQTKDSPNVIIRNRVGVYFHNNGLCLTVGIDIVNLQVSP